MSGTRFTPGLDVARDELGAVTSDLQKQLDDQAKASVVGIQGVDVPVIDLTYVPTFIQAKKGHLNVVLRFTQYGSAVDLKVVFVARAEIVTSDDYDQKRFSGKLGDKIQSGTTSTTSRVDVLLDPNTQYDVIGLVAIGADGTDRARNPTPDPLFSSYPGNVLLTFTTPAQAPAAGAPSKPTTARIVKNIIDPSSDGSIAIATLRIYGDETQLKDFADQGIASVQPKVVLQVDGTKAPSPPVNIDDPTVLFIDDSVGGLAAGKQYSWTKNTAFDADGLGTDAPATGSVFFIAGGFADSGDGLAGLTLVSLTGTIQADGSMQLAWVLSQPNPPYRLKNCRVERKLSSETDAVFDDPASLIVDHVPLQDPDFNKAGNITIIIQSVPAKPAKTYKFRLTVRSPNPNGTTVNTKQFISGDISSGALSIVAGTGVAAPSLINGGGMYASKNDFTILRGGVSVPADAVFLGARWEIPANSGVLVDNLGAGGGGSLDTKGLQWKNTESRLMFNTDCFTKGGKPASLLAGKFLRPDQIYTFGCQLICDTADVTENITIAFYDQGNAADIVAVTINGVVISHLVQQWFICILKIPHGYVNAGKQWIEKRMGSNPTNKVYATQFNLQPGIADISKWQANSEEGNITPGNITYHGEGSNQGTDIVITDNAGNVYDPTVTQGGILSLP